MHKCQNFRVGICLQRLFDFLWIDGFPPVILDHNRNAAGAFGVLFHASAEYAILRDDHLVTR